MLRGYEATLRTEFFLVDSKSEVDLVALKAFLEVVRDSGVASFSGFGINVTYFPQDSSVAWPVKSTLAEAAAVYDDTRQKLKEGKDGWRNPALWPQHSGKVLKLDGSLE